MVAGDATSEDSVAERFINEVWAKNHAFYATDRGYGALKDLQQTFPHPWLYVGELIQNAVDAGARRIRLAVDEEAKSLVVEHDGTPFNQEHVEALCVRGMSKKGAGTVGFMGIGFKAVFQSFECVEVSSGPWRFRFCVREVIGEFGDRQRHWLGYVLPEHAAEIDEPSSGMTCRFALHKRLDRLGPVEEDVTKVLSDDLLVLGLLARRGIEEVEWKGQRWVLNQMVHRLDEEFSRISLTARHDSSGEIRQWVLFSAKYRPSKGAIARFLEHRQIQPKPEERESVYAEAQRERSVEVFCPLDQDGIPEPPHRGQAFALLPTGVTVPVGLHVQADWLLVTSRREIMEVETNEWHREILARLAGLIRSYLRWVTELSNVPEHRLAGIYAVLPDWSETEGPFVAYVNAPEFPESVRAALSSLAFLPVRTQYGIRFATSAEGRLLPPALRVFDDEKVLPWALFGDVVVSTALLGARALASLEALAVFKPLAVDDLVAYWESGKVGYWRAQLGAGGVEAHLKLIRAIASFDNHEAWRAAPLRCLPASDGKWIARQHAVGLPAEWDAIPEQDPPLRSWLEPFVAPSEQRLDWSFDRTVRRDNTAQPYVAEIKRHSLDEVLGAWWATLPRSLDEAEHTRVLDVTCWVLMKQRQRPGLVIRALCENGTLTTFDHVVLADPYAGRARRRFFPDRQVVSDRYLHHKPGSSDADWRSFFESASCAINGPFRVTTSARELSYTDLRQALPGYSPPSTKSSPINARWGKWSFYSANYLLVDAVLPQEFLIGLVADVMPDVARDAGLWLNEARQDLSGNARLRVAYVPYYSSSISTDTTEFPSSWVQKLKAAQWIFAMDGSGPYSPQNTLARFDPARPGAPVADLPEELVKTLESCSIQFGTSIPEIASIERLRREGSSANAERLVQLLETAISDARDEPEREEELRHILRTLSIVPVPKTSTVIDGVHRVSAERFVQRSVRGGELGGWLLALDAIRQFDNRGIYAQLLLLITYIYAVPDAPTWEQALAFLRWVWQVQPDAELVRRTLPRAYRLIAENINDNTSRPAAWNESRAQAMVYVTSRKWTSVVRDDLFLDDLGDERLKGMVGALLLATPGHLGETFHEQHQVALLLGIRQLSSRFQVKLQLDGEQVLPTAWVAALSDIVTLIHSYAQEEDWDEVPLHTPDISYYQHISKSLVDSGVETNRWEAHAARDGGRICVAGEPDDFAADLCRVLLQWAGFANRRDLDELAPTLTQLIGWLDRQDKFNTRLEQLRVQRGLQPASATSQVADIPSSIESSQDGPLPKPPFVPIGPPTQETTSLPMPSELLPSDPVPDASSDDRGSGTQSSADNGSNHPIPPPPPSGGYTADDREGRLQALRKRRAEIDAQENALLGVGPVPNEGDVANNDGVERPGKFGSDLVYREAALAYERRAGRHPMPKDAGQPGYDIDSFDTPFESPECRLVRRIEVKGRGSRWEADETVELSDRQFLDALRLKTDDIALADDFDYWLYVVERCHDGSLEVIALKNPAKRAAKFEFRGGTWRALADEGTKSEQS
jgi:hypothetical protein